MKQVIFEIVSNEALTKDVYRMVLSGDTSAITAPGQFVEIALPGKFLRRPISVNDWGENSLTLIYKVVGHGTQQMALLPAGTRLDLLTGLGNGYDTTGSNEYKSKPAQHSVKELQGMGVNPDIIILRADGSVGTRGFVTDVLKALPYSYFYACGPLPMFKAMEAVVSTAGQYSMEERMGCGFGACMGCSIQTRSGAKRVCKDGPVFPREEVFF